MLPQRQEAGIEDMVIGYLVAGRAGKRGLRRDSGREHNSI